VDPFCWAASVALLMLAVVFFTVDYPLAGVFMVLLTAVMIAADSYCNRPIPEDVQRELRRAAVTRRIAVRAPAATVAPTVRHTPTPARGTGWRQVVGGRGVAGSHAARGPRPVRTAANPS
jgi:hypothetical protein